MNGFIGVNGYYFRVDTIEFFSHTDNRLSLTAGGRDYTLTISKAEFAEFTETVSRHVRVQQRRQEEWFK